MRDFSRRTEKIAICRGEWEISRSVAENVKNRDLSRRIGNFAVSYMPRNPFVPAQEHLNRLLMLHSHKVFTDRLSLIEIARLFVGTNERRQIFFGKFWI